MSRSAEGVLRPDRNHQGYGREQTSGEELANALSHGLGCLAALIAHVGEAVGVAPDALRTTLVEPLEAEGVRLLYVDGVTWVAVWLLVYPLVVPMPLLPQVVGTLLTAAVVPAILYAGSLVTGVPDSVAPWAMPYAIQSTVPTFICAGIALIASRVVYGLTRDLSKARRLGHYELVEQIGAGGMGQVWRAKHQLLVRPAAVKLIRPELLGDDPNAARVAIGRFEREVQLAARLHHPHTITVYDYGQTDDGVFYYVMELLDGMNLDEFVQRYGPVPADRAVHWLRQACASLHEAHASGLIHRDVKPANLFVCRYGLETDFLKVLDFGLVKTETPASGAEFDTRMTAAREAPGTPAFMPPELGLGHEVDARGDLYALGCVAYWLLTGTTVFEGGTAMEILVKHAREAPVPPSERTELEIPGDVEEIVLACLAKDPQDRPASAWELERRLAACSVADAWTPEQRQQWWDLHVPVTEPA